MLETGASNLGEVIFSRYGVDHQIGEEMKWHPLVIDKITDIEGRSSFEDYDDYLVLSSKCLISILHTIRWNRAIW